jgi:hypothetical protein
MIVDFIGDLIANIDSPHRHASRAERPRRFRTTAFFDGGPELATRSKEIVRDAWASEEPRSA